MSREMIAMCELAFSGKSTVAAKVAAALGLEPISYNAINAQRGFEGGKAIADAGCVRPSSRAFPVSGQG